MKFERTDVWGFKHALRGMRNPMNSWNKKLTFKAYRAAQALAGELSALYPAAA
jgi:hypothetical protein